jgi:hypothetical protein
MRRLFRAGLVAASAQILAVAVATVAVTIALRRGLVVAVSGAAQSEVQLRSVSYRGSISS